MSILRVNSACDVVVVLARSSLAHVAGSPVGLTGRLLHLCEGFMPAWYMNQNSWVTILLDGSVPAEEIRSYLDMAFDSAGDKRGKR